RVVAGRLLHRDRRGEVHRRPVLDAPRLAPDVPGHLAELGQERVPGAGDELDRGDHVDHGGYSPAGRGGITSSVPPGSTRRKDLPAMSRAALVAALGLGLLAPVAPPVPAAEEPPVPEVPREFRGVWVASVSNIDWPSQPGLPT